ncbi:MAG: hypothetical protein R3F61_03480 [Myxococcota bacterium]
MSDTSGSQRDSGQSVGPPGFVEALLAVPDVPLSRLARYTFWNGVFYMGLGSAMFFAPASVWSAALATPADQVGTGRLLGMSVGVIGWFYAMGARTGATSFGLATVVDRALVPFLLGGLVLTGQVGVQQVAGLGIVDPLLAVGAFLLWRADR